eukprot:m.296893 g.296893  ORF g.296893 m.296893 type:complete len:96 (-) comp27193_c3_seq30:587-874(-)
MSGVVRPSRVDVEQCSETDSNNYVTVKPDRIMTCRSDMTCRSAAVDALWLLISVFLWQYERGEMSAMIFTVLAIIFCVHCSCPNPAHTGNTAQCC